MAAFLLLIFLFQGNNRELQGNENVNMRAQTGTKDWLEKQHEESLAKLNEACPTGL